MHDPPEGPEAACCSACASANTMTSRGCLPTATLNKRQTPRQIRKLHSKGSLQRLGRARHKMIVASQKAHPLSGCHLGGPQANPNQAKFASKLHTQCVTATKTWRVSWLSFPTSAHAVGWERSPDRVPHIEQSLCTQPAVPGPLHRAYGLRRALLRAPQARPLPGEAPLCHDARPAVSRIMGHHQKSSDHVPNRVCYDTASPNRTPSLQKYSIAVHTMQWSDAF